MDKIIKYVFSRSFDSGKFIDSLGYFPKAFKIIKEKTNKGDFIV